MNSCLYAGTVMHHRFRPKRHRFTYRVFSALIDLDELADLDRRLRLFSVDRFNLFSWHNRDHGEGSAIPLAEQIRTRLEREGLSEWGASIRLLCYPRILGYVFNPLSVYYCYNAAQQLGAILYEVSNTFGERHTYLIAVPADLSANIIRQQSDKAFYVSPFMPFDADYQFRMQPPGKQIAVCIRQCDQQGSLLHATFTGQQSTLTDARLGRYLIRYPLMTLKVIAGIHWEAFRLWRKGVPLQTRKKQENNRLTIGKAMERSGHETL